MLFNWYAPELWRRFTIGLRRQVRTYLRGIGEHPDGVRLSYVKVIEMQRRAVAHFHTVIRLDAPTDPTQPPSAPDTALTAAALAQLVLLAANAVCLDVTDRHGTTRTLGFGTQTDIQPVGHAASPGNSSGAHRDVTPGRKVAGYLAKYVTKSVAEFGIGVRRMSPKAIATLNVTDHVRTLLTTLARYAERPAYREMLRWLHTLGYRGHITTKSRRFSVTMGALRLRRTQWREQHGTASGDANNNFDAQHDSRSATEYVEWEFDRSGHATPGDRVLALSAAQHARAHRHTVRDALAEAKWRAA